MCFYMYIVTRYIVLTAVLFRFIDVFPTELKGSYLFFAIK